MITEEQFKKLDSKYGLEYFLEIEKTLDDSDYWTILRALWIEQGENNQIFYDLFFNTKHKRSFKIMKSSDRQELKKLPKRVKIYRACMNEEDVNKINWTTNYQFACKYQKMINAKYIAEMEIDKKEIFAYFNSRKENEVILKR